MTILESVPVLVRIQPMVLIPYFQLRINDNPRPKFFNMKHQILSGYKNGSQYTVKPTDEALHMDDVIAISFSKTGKMTAFHGTSEKEGRVIERIEILETLISLHIDEDSEEKLLLVCTEEFAAHCKLQVPELPIIYMSTREAAQFSDNLAVTHRWIAYDDRQYMGSSSNAVELRNLNSRVAGGYINLCEHFTMKDLRDIHQTERALEMESLSKVKAA